MPASPNGVRDRIENGLERWGRIAHRHAWPLLAVCLAVTLGLASFIPDLETDNSTESFLHERDPIRIRYDAFRRQFGRDERITLAIETADPFAAETLARLRSLHRDLEREVPHVEELTSLVNARDTRGEGQTLVVGELLEDWPESAAELAALRERALANPLYENTLLSRDGRVTLLSIELVAFAGRGAADAFSGFDEEPGADDGADHFLPEREIARSVQAAREVVARYDAPDFRIRLGGAPVLSDRLNERMQADMVRFTQLSILAIGACLFLLFRRLSAVFLPLLVVGLSLLSTLGIMALSGGTFTIATQLLPSLLLAVGVCDAVHVLAIHERRLAAGDDREEAIAFTLGHSGLAILMTTLTTAGGFASFAVGELKPVADLGLYAPIGVGFALVYTLVMLPALLAIVPVRPRARVENDRLTRVLRGLGDVSARYPWSVVSVTVALLCVALAGAVFLRFSHDPIDWLPDDDPLREAMLYMNDRLDGVNVVEIVADTGRENGVHEPDLLRRLEAVRHDAARIHRGPWHIGKTTSIVDVVEETHQALNENRPEYRVVPDDRRLVAQELLLFENSGSDDLEQFVDPLFSTARITMRVPWMDAIRYPVLVDDLGTRVAERLGDGVEVEITGLVPMLARTFRAMLESMARSYALAIVVIAPLMILLIGNPLRGLLAMIPNLAPVVGMLGYMGWSGTPVDGLTMMVGAIVIGLAVDDTIHFMHNFRRYYERSGDARLAIRRTLETTGRALLVTSVVLSAGFFVYLGAHMRNVQSFGLLAGMAILVAFVANVMLASSLMVLATRPGVPLLSRLGPPGRRSGRGPICR